MIQIDRHIEILLLDNDCVIVPGLGGFIAHHVPAQYDESSNTFTPPSRTLGFNAQLKINDSLLAQSYIEAYDISYPEAIRRIEGEVVELQQTLNNNGSCELYDIGVLKINDEGKIEFVPCEAGVLTPSLYGYNSLDILPLNAGKKGNTATNKAQIANEDNNIELETIVPIPHIMETPADGEQNTTKEVEEESRTISIRLSTIKYIAASAAAILLLFLFSSPFGINNDELFQVSRMDTGLMKILPKEIIQPTTNQVKKDFPKKENLSTIIIKEEVSTPEVKEVKREEIKNENIATKDETAIKTKSYCIVLASKVTELNAREFITNQAKRGINARLHKDVNGNKVVYGNYKSEEEARNDLREHRVTETLFDEAWIMEIK